MEKLLGDSADQHEHHQKVMGKLGGSVGSLEQTLATMQKQLLELQDRSAAFQRNQAGNMDLPPGSHLCKGMSTEGSLMVLKLAKSLFDGVKEEIYSSSGSAEDKKTIDDYVQSQIGFEEVNAKILRSM